MKVIRMRTLMMNLLPPDLVAQIHAQVASGNFQSEEHVLREALAALARRQQGLARLQALIADAEADVAAGRVEPFDRDELKREVRAQLAARGVAD
jgi:Arc/MetJ-type ribon-helix-helix transcriptional regulator